MSPRKLFLPALAATFFISACSPDEASDTGNPDEPSDTESPRLLTELAPGTVLLADEMVTLTFSEPVDIESFQITQHGAEITNFTANWLDENTTVQLTPDPIWGGGDNTITLHVADVDGNMASFTVTARINLTFGIDPQAEQLFGELVEAERDYYGNPFIDEKGIWLADYDEPALYFFNSLPATPDAEPDHVITAMDFLDSETQEVAQQEISGPQTPFVYNGQLLFVDYSDGLVYLFDDIPTSEKLNFGIVLGQPGFAEESEADACSAERFSSPEGLNAVNDRLLVADGDNNRILIWSQIPTESGTLPDLVLGQFDFVSCDDGLSEFALDYPSGVWSDGTKVLVVDGGNNRVLGWNTFPTANNQPADFVLGQPDFISNDCNLDAETSTAAGLCDNYEGVHSNGRQIYVTDSGNNRVLVWNDWPTESGVPADQVIGQADFSTVTDDEFETVGHRFGYPTGVYAFDHRLLVADQENGNIVVFDGSGFALVTEEDESSVE
ncbi:hypothetical protein [Reinekea blandensis]|uniref:SbsA Ig-like domain-containing protein n=1 Tax=Reinekea blandensis MED297 TaxID=314283 RepID=A4BAT3_9GAMM|nr:hypothetical protein [Reinekea blandensis]EAR10546.1 hypothetical protein MED297_11040 [Reinekea sp. MED297] [Reinekea blandensis MED297]